LVRFQPAAVNQKPHDDIDTADDVHDVRTDAQFFEVRLLRAQAAALGLRLNPEGDWPARTDARPSWFYRVHGGGISSGERLPHNEERALVMQDACHLAVLTPFAGREWALNRYIRSLERIGWAEDRLHGVFIDNSGDEGFGKRLRAKLINACAGWRSVRFVRDMAQATPDHSNAQVGASAELRMAHNDLGAVFSRLYAQEGARLLGSLPDLVLTLEDDVELVGEAVVPMLLRHLDPDVMAVSGVVRSRFERQGRSPAPIVYQVDSEAPYRQHLLHERVDGAQDVGGTGVGCLLSRAEAWERHMPLRSSVNGDGRHQWHDVAWAADIRRAGYRWVVDWTVRTKHWGEGGTWV